MGRFARSTLRLPSPLKCVVAFEAKRGSNFRPW